MAVRRFHKYIYGRRFTLLTDHKPLLSIFGSKKGIPVHSANRLQRWALVLLGYDFDIQYRQTDSFGQADALSRLISNHTTVNEDSVVAAILSPDDPASIVLSNAVRALPVTAADVQKATRTDPTLWKAINFTRTKWPSTKFEGDIKHLANRRESLCVVNDCLMFHDRVVIPATLRAQLLRQFHSGHPGISRMKSIARSYAYWPNMDRDIEVYVKKCAQCQQAAKNPCKLPPIPWPETKQPWSRIHIDFAGPVNGVTYLVLVDAFSKWPEVIPITPPSTSKTINILSQVFSQHGLPDTIVSDNGSQFTSSQFQDFCRKNAINHMFSPPYHP